jgi:hypothetical protein
VVISVISLQDMFAGKVVAIGCRCKDGLHVLERNHFTFVFFLNNSLRASYDIWHACLGHVSHSVISLLNKKKSYLFVTSLLPSPNLCVACQIAKSHKLHFNANDQRASHILNLIHCDIWGPAHVMYLSNFCYYIIFIDDHSCFT